MDGSIGTVSLSPVVKPSTPASDINHRRTETQQSTSKAADQQREERQEQITQAVEMANAIAQFLDKKIAFSYDRRINKVIVRVVRESTGEVIRQIPPEEMVDHMVRLQEDFRGLILNHSG